MLESEHIEKSRIERFCVSALPEEELIASAEHLAKCVSCHDSFIACLKLQKGSGQLSFTLAPEYWLQHEHLDYEQLAALADKTLDAEDRQILDTHLRACAMCREAVGGFLAFREQIESEVGVPSRSSVQEPAYTPASRFSWWGLNWNPAYAAAVLLIGIALVIGIALLLTRRAGNLEAKKTQPSQGVISPASQTPTPDNQAVNVQPTPAPVPSEQLPRRAPSPALRVKNQESLKPLEKAVVVASLNDELGKVTVDKAGNVSGLDEIPQSTRQEIGEALVAENIRVPATQTELGGGPIVLRGPDNNPTFRLRSPARTVINLDRPSFEWEKPPGATSYRVSVGDLKGHEIAKSEELPADQAKWIPPTSLKRGEIYVWEVEATIDGKKIVSPGRSAPQMKFKILSENSAQELEQLKKTRSHLALGVFCAHEGMVADAEHQFRILVHNNPRSLLLKKLLKQIQSW
jgi:hypothetical protein